MTTHLSIDNLRGPAMRGSSSHAASAHLSWDGAEAAAATAAERTGVIGGYRGRSESHAAAHHGDIPRNEDDITHYILYDGLPQSGPHVQHARERQADAYLHFTHRIHERVEAAHAVVLSANPLSLSVMASQLRMYRWRVTETQTLLETTSVLQDYVVDVAKHGYRVRRRPAAPFGQSRYAYGRGKSALKRIAQEERAKLAGKQVGGGSSSSHGAHTTTSVSNSHGSTPSAKTKADDGTLASRQASNRSSRADGGRAVANAATHPSAAAAAADSARPSLYSAAAATAMGDDDHPQQRNGEEDEEEAEEEEAAAADRLRREEDRLPLPAPDALPRLVLVDGFTHEDFADIARHIRFVDHEHGLDLLLILLLPADPAAAAAATQGAGCVVTPQHETTLADAYAAGYDLVLAHGMDNLLVDFLTSAFVSSVGRWRNDVRSKAAVGNYMSVRNVLLGGLDTASLQQLVWDDNTDDARVLELLGAQSLAVHGDSKRYGEVSRKLLGQPQTQLQQQQQQLESMAIHRGDPLSAAMSEGNSAATTEANDYGAGSNSSITNHRSSGSQASEKSTRLRHVASTVMSHVPRLRSRPASVAHFGVRLPADAQHAQMPMTSFGKTQDVLGGIMAPVTAAGGGQRGGADGGHSGRRGHRRRGLGDGSGSGDGDDEEEDDDSSVSDLFTDDALRDPQMLQTALEKEMGRLMAENEGKQSSINALQEEVAGLQRMVAVMKRQQTGHSNHNNSGGEDGDLASSGGLRSGERPDSGSVVQLAKQQQIFLLKERLEAANDHIAALLRDGRSSSILANGKAAPGARGRGGGGAGGLVGVGRLGGRLASGSGAAFAASVTTARRGVGGSGGNSGSQRGATAAAERFRRRAYEAYQSAREGEMMGLLDDDADIANAALQRLSQEAGAAASVVALSNSVTQRREQEATDSVLRSLQDDLRFLQGGLDKGGAAERQSDDDKHSSSEVAALQARMATHLQAAVERLEAERQRVRHLEQLRQTDQLLLAHAARMTEHVRRRGAAAAGSRDSAGGDSSSSGSDDDDDEEEDGDGVSSSGNRRSREQHGGKSRAGGATKKREKGAKGAAKVGGAAAVATAGSRKAGAAGADGGKKAAAGEGKGKGSAARKKTKAGRTPSSSRGGAVRTGRAVDDETIEVAEVEGLIAAAVTDAVASRNRVFRRQLAALVQTCKSQLARVVLKHQKPRTVAYMQLLEEELAQAKRDQRGAFLRLRFTLTHLRPDQYDESCIPPPPLPPQPPHVDGSSVESQAAASLTSETSHAASTAMQDDVGEGAEGEDDGAAPAMIPLRAVTDPDVRQAAERIAREHAAFALRVAYMSEELQRVRAAHAAETEPAAAATAGDAMEKTLPPHSPSSSSSAPSPSHSRTPVQLLRAYRKATQHVRAAVEGVEPVQRYLDAVLAEMEAEQRLSPWCDVDCAQLFQGLPELSSAWAGNAAVSPGSGLALVPTHLQYAAYPSPEEFTLHLADESMPLLLADVDGSVRDVAGLYGVLLQSCVSMADDCHGDDGYDHGRFGFGGDSVIHASSGGGGRLTPTATASGEGECGAAGLGKRVPAEGLGGGHGHRSSTESAEATRTAVQPRLTVMQALAQLPVEASAVAQYQGQLGRLYAAEGACSATQLRLYEAVLRAYQQHQINPLHMAAVEAAVLYTASSGSAKSAASAFAEAGSPGGQRTHLHVAHAQHHEVLTTLQLLSPNSAAASPSSSSSSSSAFRLLVQQVCRQQRALEQELTAPPHMVSKGRLVVTPCTSAAFLNALDAALLGCMVDELRWRQLRRVADEDGAVVAALVAARSAGASRGSGGLFPPSSASTAPSMADAEWDEGGHESAPPPRIVAHYAAFCAAHARNAAQGGDAAQLDGAAADMFDLSALSVTSQGSADAYSQLAALFPGGIPGAASGGGGGGGGRSTAQQLAALFSRQGGEAAAAAQLSGSAAGGGMTAEAEAALLRGIYLSDASAGKGSGGGDAGDDNAQAIRRLRMEIEYMDALRKQRIDELALRCGWSAQQRQEMFGDSVAGSYDGHGDYFASSTTAGAAAAAGGGYPDIDPDRLKFEVKSGTSAWYGMEAAKRVRAILRRRALPDQIIVGGGPDGGVGIELSRRTAEPATAAPATPPPLSSDVNEAAKRADTGAAGEGSAQPHRGHPSPPLLPPIRPSGVSGTQPQQRVEARQHDAAPLPYISPRDALSLSAYGNLMQTSDPHNRGSSSSGAAYAYDHVHDGGSDLQQRVMAYRAELTRAAGRLSPSSTATYADGAPYCLPLASPPPQNTQPGAATGGLRPRPPLPQQTSWVYGVPASSAASLVDQQSGVDPQQPRDTLLFMPPKPFSPMAEAAVRGAARVAPRFPTPSASSASSSAFTTPAAMAAQRLQTMLMASMVDPAVVTSPPRRTAPRSSAPVTSGAAAVSTSPPTTPRRETRAGRTEGGGGRLAAGDEEAGQQREQPHQLDTTIGPETELVVPEYDHDA